jgi:hypothetical protein
MARLEQRNAHLEHELKLQGQSTIRNALKESVMLKRKLAQRG